MFHVKNVLACVGLVDLSIRCILKIGELIQIVLFLKQQLATFFCQKLIKLVIDVLVNRIGVVMELLQFGYLWFLVIEGNGLVWHQFVQLFLLVHSCRLFVFISLRLLSTEHQAALKMVRFVELYDVVFCLHPVSYLVISVEISLLVLLHLISVLIQIYFISYAVIFLEGLSSDLFHYVASLIL